MRFHYLYFGRWLFALALSLLAARADAQVYYLSLDKQTLDVPGRTFYVEQVLDGRTDRAGIGLVRPQFGLVYATTLHPADLSPNLVTGLTQFLQAQLPARPTDHPALLLVRELRVGEVLSGNAQTGTGIIRQARATVDLYLHAADGYRLVQTATDTVRPAGAIGVTPSHERNMKKVLENCLAQFSAADWAAAQNRPARSLAELTRIGHVAAGATAGYAITADSARLIPGYFPNFLAFRNNQPVATPSLHVRKTPRPSPGWENLPHITPFVTSEGKERALPESWGFTDGEQLYIRYLGYYAQLQRQGNTFGFGGPSEMARQELKAGNLLGAVLVDHRPVAYTLDLLTGRATQFADAGRAATRTDTARIFVYRTNEAGPAQAVYLNDQLVGALAENQFVQLLWADAVHEPHLRLGAASGSELTFIPNFREAIYVRVVRKPDLTKIPLEIVQTKVGVFEMKQLKLRSRK